MKTAQQREYEAAYASTESEYGMPDRKIADGALRDKRILSIGCGTGNDLWHLTTENEVLGLDYAQSAPEVARRHNVQILECDLNCEQILPFADNSFDIIVLKDILEHLLDPLAVLKEVRRVMNENGYAVISVPNHFYWLQRLRYLLGGNLIVPVHRSRYDEWDYMHIRFFTYSGFCRFLKAADLESSRWFWDFGYLAHYRNPDLWLEPQIWKFKHGKPMSTRGKLGLYVLRPAWQLFNFVFPRQLRHAIISLAPGVLCAGFYVHVRKRAQ
jgi:methionine biosynthesis protein MetW